MGKVSSSVILFAYSCFEKDYKKGSKVHATISIGNMGIRLSIKFDNQVNKWIRQTRAASVLTVTFFSDFLAILRSRNRDLKVIYWFFISASEILGKVAVTVGSPDGTWNSLDETEFEYHPNVTQELQKLISKMPDTKRNIPLDYQTLNPSLSAGTGQTLCLFLKLYTAYGILFCDDNHLINICKSIKWDKPL